MSPRERASLERIATHPLSHPEARQVAKDLLADEAEPVATIERRTVITKKIWPCGCESDAEGNRYFYLCGLHMDEIGVEKEKTAADTAVKE